MNTNVIIIVVLVIVVIYFLSQNTPKKENFGWFTDMFNPSQNQNQNQNINCGDMNMGLCDIGFKGICPKECEKGTNSLAQCREWAFRNSNECSANPNYMLNMCQQACNERTALDMANPFNRILNR